MRKLLFILLISMIGISTFGQNYYIAHRGASYLAPENTLAAANLAWELGAEAVEIDVHLSADKRIMVIHDGNTSKTSRGKADYEIALTPSELLRQVDVGSYKSADYAGEKIPYLEEILTALPAGKTLVVEIKCGPEIMPYLEEAVGQSGKRKQLVFISFGWDVILEAKEKFPDNPCYYLKMNPLGLKKKMKTASKMGLDGVNLYYRIINRRVMRKAEKHGLEVLAWTVDDPRVVKKLNTLGVYKITTNRPVWLQNRSQITPS